ncbi:L-proline dehydrogenase /delta-1-pyrroline-5-carboxylate dehydrogenase [Pseudofulvimonas gallinarii]|uniref:Bifunctional protein PutA n=1 Tax=Pseudofulvimonas gallinarii TaxID=634155 RepID=A0A4R3L4U0_9GAMM|nr:bifunctional proline dehydrogenase/L-glutamate gamma-semialdehyde dehydrogenase PutA [Pseudofulvimonas gallinarii]TCS93780.1 L-proline dehydrogenase /delta-1-pyrroline-5-carboxylate dehydrogenase [Pseudofulvimonas gallinarii]
MNPILLNELPPAPDATRAAMTALWHADEAACLAPLLAQATLPADERDRVLARAAALVEAVRARASQASAVESFMRQYDLSSEEGVLLMCVAEALLRIPDADTADKLIADKLSEADWDKHLGKSNSVLVNASTWGLMLTGRLVALSEDTRRSFSGALRRLIGRSGEPVIRLAVRQAMKIMGHQFVMGRTIKEALKRSRDKDNRAYRHSFDMLGEAALTTRDAERYFTSYQDAIRAIGAAGPYADIYVAPSISVKLSALHPRYEVAKRARVLAELVPKLLDLARLARDQGIALTVDAEEADRLELSLEVMEPVFADPDLAGWNGFGLAVQAYMKRAPAVIDWLAERAHRHGRRWCVRLVKGAYWDAEIKRAQENGHDGYPVYTRKANTDVSYLACARKLLADPAAFFPQFATHNAHTIASIEHLAGDRQFEFQRLHGMGEDLYEAVIGEGDRGLACRVYAPVGSHEDLLPYLVRRLLENGANTSFVNRIVDESLAVSDLVADPVGTVAANEPKAHPHIPLPADLYGASRRNSRGFNMANDADLHALAAQISAADRTWTATPLVPGFTAGSPDRGVTNPADRRQRVGAWQAADAALVQRALDTAVKAQPAWDRGGVEPRAQALLKAADLLEERRPELIALCVREAGKSLAAAIAEVREAVDFLRYYAQQARGQFGTPLTLPGPTGESNQLHLHGRGVFVCISPWNFPLAIYVGQVAAALVAGNAVIAKPAEQTTLVAHLATTLLHHAGVPAEVLQFLPGDGGTVGAALTSDARVAGVAFTGSTETAWAINRALAARNAPIAALVAETGGQNAMIADSSSLPEQVVKDALVSAFDSAGQRCSAARVLLVQDDIADKVMTMLAGAMAELVVGDPANLSTDVGPVIDEDARRTLQAHIERMHREARLIHAVTLPESVSHGCFVAPHAFEIPALSVLEREVFGPVLHVLRYRSRDLDAVIDQVNATGYGLTLGVHSRIDDTVEHIVSRVRAGNCYVNRNQVGAVVGVQPFGGEGLSGTGPKAGGPHYLARFASERTVTINTTAAGGNASLLTLDA